MDDTDANTVMCWRRYEVTVTAGADADLTSLQSIVSTSLVDSDGLTTALQATGATGVSVTSTGWCTGEPGTAGCMCTGLEVIMLGNTGSDPSIQCSNCQQQLQMLHPCGFDAALCVEGAAASCTDIACGATDSQGNGCEDVSVCGATDDADFTASVMCCACQGSDGGVSASCPASDVFTLSSMAIVDMGSLPTAVLAATTATISSCDNTMLAADLPLAVASTNHWSQFEEEDQVPRLSEFHEGHIQEVCLPEATVSQGLRIDFGGGIFDHEFRIVLSRPDGVVVLRSVSPGGVTNCDDAAVVADVCVDDPLGLMAWDMATMKKCPADMTDPLNGANFCNGAMINENQQNFVFPELWDPNQLPLIAELCPATCGTCTVQEEAANAECICAGGPDTKCVQAMTVPPATPDNALTFTSGSASGDPRFMYCKAALRSLGSCESTLGCEWSQDTGADLETQVCMCTDEAESCGDVRPPAIQFSGSPSFAGANDVCDARYGCNPSWGCSAVDRATCGSMPVQCAAGSDYNSAASDAICSGPLCDTIVDYGFSSCGDDPEGLLATGGTNCAAIDLDSNVCSSTQTFMSESPGGSPIMVSKSYFELCPYSCGHCQSPAFEQLVEDINNVVFGSGADGRRRRRLQAECNSELMACQASSACQDITNSLNSDLLTDDENDALLDQCAMNAVCLPFLTCMMGSDPCEDQQIACDDSSECTELWEALSDDNVPDGPPSGGPPDDSAEVACAANPLCQAVQECQSLDQSVDDEEKAGIPSSIVSLVASFTGADQSTCCACRPGFYQQSSGCSSCPAGTFSGALGQTSCEVCEPGHVTASADVQCVDYDITVNTLSGGRWMRWEIQTEGGLTLCQSAPPERVPPPGTSNVCECQNDPFLTSKVCDGGYPNCNGYDSGWPGASEPEITAVESCCLPPGDYMVVLGCSNPQSGWRVAADLTGDQSEVVFEYETAPSSMACDVPYPLGPPSHSACGCPIDPWSNNLVGIGFYCDHNTDPFSIVEAEQLTMMGSDLLSTPVDELAQLLYDTPAGVTLPGCSNCENIKVAVEDNAEDDDMFYGTVLSGQGTCQLCLNTCAQNAASDEVANECGARCCHVFCEDQQIAWSANPNGVEYTVSQNEYWPSDAAGVQSARIGHGWDQIGSITVGDLGTFGPEFTSGASYSTPITVPQPTSVGVLPDGTEVYLSMSEGSTHCVQCEPGKYDADGDPLTACLACAPPNVITNGATSCAPCDAGFEPLGDFSGCTRCLGSTFSPCGEACIVCPFPNVVFWNSTTCLELDEDVQISDISTVTAALDTGTNVVPQTTLHINADASSLVEGSAAQAAFIEDLRQQLATSLGLLPENIEISGLRPAADSTGRRRAQSSSIAFEMVVVNCPDVGAVLQDLTAQMQNTSSTLLSNLDLEGTGPSFSFTCPLGMYRTDEMPDCEYCQGSSIPDMETGRKSCRDCVPGRAPRLPELDICVCSAGMYNASQGGELKCYDKGEMWKVLPARTVVDECISCLELECVTCEANNNIRITAGYATAVGQTAQGTAFPRLLEQRAVFPCPSDGTCSGDFEQPCTASSGTAGPLCNTCADGFSRVSGVCTQCGSSTTNTVLLFLGAPTAVALLMVFLYYVDSAHTATSAKVTFAMTAVKTSITLIQVVTQLQFSIDIKWPSSFASFIEALKFVSLDFLGFLDVGCVAELTYYGKFTFASLLTPVLLGGVGVVYVLLSSSFESCGFKHGDDHLSHTEIVDRCSKMALTVIFLVFPFVCQTTFAGFSCLQLAEEESWLAVDYQISCEADSHFTFMATLGALNVLLYPIGIPLGTLFLLLKNKDEIAAQGPAADRYDFLVGDYESRYYFWEVAEMFRKVFLTGLLMFFGKGSLTQLVFAMISSLMFMAAVAWLQPFTSRIANLFKLFCELALLMTMMLSVLLKIDLSRQDLTTDTIGVWLILINSVWPVVGIATGLVAYKDDLQEIRELTETDFDSKDSSGPSEEFVNPSHEADEGDEASDADNSRV